MVYEREMRLATLDAAIAKALEDVVANRMKASTEVFDRLEAKYRDVLRSKALMNVVITGQDRSV